METFPVGLHKAATWLLTVLAAGGYFFADPGWSRLLDALIAAPFIFLALLILLAPFALAIAAVWGLVSGILESQRA